MKLFVLFVSLLLAVLSFAQDPIEIPSTPGGLLIVDTKGVVPKPPLFFAADAKSTIKLTHTAITQSINVNVRVLQGKPDVITLALFGHGDITAVTGDHVQFWAVRQGTGDDASKRFLEIRPKLPGKDEPDLTAFQATITTTQELESLPNTSQILTLGPGESVGFSAQIEILADKTVSPHVTDSTGWLSAATTTDDGPLRFQTTGTNALTLQLEARGVAANLVEFTKVRLDGQVDRDTESASFTLTGTAIVRDEKGGKLKLLSGQAALRELPTDVPYQTRLISQGDDAPYYELEFSDAGEFPISLDLDARLQVTGEWQAFDFTVPASAIVPMRLTGLPEDLRFDSARAVFPTRSEGDWLGFLPPSGRATTAWRSGKEEEDGKLFFATREQSEISVSAGLLRQALLLQVSVLQGKLNGVQVDLFGEGEILAVEGQNVLGWTVTPGNDGVRRLEIPLSQALDGQAQFLIRSQTPVGAFPITATPVRLAPVDSVRHSGILRIGNQGAVRLQLSGLVGMTQLSPDQFPGELSLTNGSTQVYVYRLPSANYAYEIQADQITPEVNVSQIVVYHMGDSDRQISAAIELDIRDAPLREWELRIPEDHAVVSVTGADVVDHVLSSQAENGTRALKVLFGSMVSGRRLLNLQLEKNEAPAAGDWALPPLTYPGAKSVRGHLGISATAGYRVGSGTIDKLSELPLTQFPKQQENLQQAYRLRESDWSATMTVEALGQSVQADVFHLYALKEGMVYGSVLLNYYVVGAPVSNWRLQVPAEMGNIGIDGEDVQTWRREGNEISVTLHEPALGPSTLLLTFEQPMSIDGGSLALGAVAPLDVQGERGFIQVVSPYQVRHEITQASDNLLSLEANELPAEFRLLTSAPSLVAYQYGARPFDLATNIQWLTPGQTVDQMIEYADLSSQISRDGQVATTAVFHVKTRGQQGLRLRLPNGATLWDARVNDRTVNARADGEFTVIPLSTTNEPNHSVRVKVRMGQPSVDPKRPSIGAPAADAPIMIHAWKVKSDHGQLLLPNGDAAKQLTQPVLTETGFEWLVGNGDHWEIGLLIFVLAVVGSCLAASKQRWRLLLGGLFILGAAVFSGFHAQQAFEKARPNKTQLEIVAPVVPPSEPLTVSLAHVSHFRAMMQPMGISLIVVGLGLFFLRKRLATIIGMLAISGGLLLHPLGAPAFFGVLALWLFFLRFVGCWRAWRVSPPTQLRAEAESGPPTPPAISTPLWLVCSLSAAALFGGANSAQAAEISASTLTQRWKIEGQRLFGEFEVAAVGKAGDRVPLLKNPAVLTAFTPSEGDSRVARRAVEGGVDYDLVLEADGRLSGTATFEMTLSQPLSRINFPTGIAAVHQIEVTLDQPGWEITSPAAVRLTTQEGEANQSNVALVLGSQGEQCLSLAPRTRDLGSETSQFYVEVDQVFLPKPGVIDARHRIVVRPSQGRVRELTMLVPNGFTVSDVRLEGLRNWRFDPETRQLQIELEAARADGFQMAVFTQQGLAGLPTDVTLEPLRVEGAAGEVGMLGLAFGPDSQPETVTATGLSAVNLEDFDASLLGKREGNPLVLHRVYRYGAESGSLALRITGVDPEIRMTTRQTLSLGEERLVLAIDLNASITRAGLFQLRFPMPAGLDVEAISGSHLDHWSEVTEADVRFIVLHLKGRSMGELTFAISLTGTAPGALDSWTVPQFTLENAARATGELIISPDLGIRAQAISRRNVSQLDTRKIARKQAGTLAFQLLQADWELALRIEQLEPWVTAQTLQEVTLREGQTRTRLAIHYEIENAAVKALRLRLPGLSPTDAQSVHATGEAISDLVRVADTEDLWEIRFQRGMLGAVNVTIDYQQPADRSVNQEAIAPAILSEVRQATHWMAVRSVGRLGLSLEEVDRRWQTADWGTVPTELRQTRQGDPPRLCVRSVAPDQPLQVRVERHAVAEALKLRVSKGQLTTLLSAGGAQVTKTVLNIDVAEKSPLRVTLPNGSILLNAFVNGQSVDLVNEGEGNTYAFYVFPQEGSPTAQVSFAYGTYESQSGNTLALVAPALELPLQDITWQIVLPNGYTLKKKVGMLELKSSGKDIRFDVNRYQAAQEQRQAQQAENARKLLERANYWLKEGQQDKAREALQSASESSSLDAASSEDARVQLRQLQTEQALLGLNSRRQSVYLENIIETPEFARNEQLEQAAHSNEVLQGELNYDPNKVDDFLLGNTAEENSALKRMAGRLVSHQQAADLGVRGLEVSLPARGELLTFHRSVQVNSSEPLRLDLTLAPEGKVPWWFVGLTIALLGGLALVGSRGQAKA